MLIYGRFYTLETTSQKKRIITEANTFRGLFCLFVVLIHTTGFATTELQAMSAPSILFSILNTAVRCAVPAFIFVSGLTLAFSYKDKVLHLKDFYLKRFKSTVIPYILYTVFYYILYIILYHYEVSWKFFFMKLVTGNMAYHLYFLVIIIQFYIVFPLILLAFRKFNHHALLALAPIIHILCFIYIPMKYRFFGNYLTFFVLGCYMALEYDRVLSWLNNKKIKWTFVAGTVLASAYYIVELYLERHFRIKLNPSNSSWQIFCLFCIPGYYILCLYLDKTTHTCIVWIRERLCEISKVSFSIYLGHPFIIMILKIFLQDLRLVMKSTTMSIILIGLCMVYAKFFPILNTWLWGYIDTLKNHFFKPNNKLDM